MRRKWMMLSVICVLSLVATAGAMTPEQMTDKIANCPNCKALGNYPDLMPNLRPEIFKTANGFVSTFLVADAKTLPSCAKWEKECGDMMAKATQADIEKHYCPICQSMGGLMGNKDVTMESFTTAMGKVTVATGKTKAGIEALHAHVALMQEAGKAMPAAMAKIMETAGK